MTRTAPPDAEAPSDGDAAFAGRRLSIDEEELNANLRLAGYVVVNQFLTGFRLMCQSTGLDPVSQLVLMTITAASIQRALRETGEGRVDTGKELLAEQHFRPISRRAVAEATGLSRETVRRKINTLIEKGLVSVDSDGGVKTMNVIANPDIARVLSQLVGGHTQATNVLLSEKVIR